MLEGLWLKTGRDVYLRLYRFWARIFAVSFGMVMPFIGLYGAFAYGPRWVMEQVGIAG